MRKNLVGTLAILFAISSIAFTNTEKKIASSKKGMANTCVFYWFKYDACASTFVYDRYDLLPSVICVGFLYPCARGYVIEPQKDACGIYICPQTFPDVELLDGP